MQIVAGERQCPTVEGPAALTAPSTSDPHSSPRSPAPFGRLILLPSHRIWRGSWRASLHPNLWRPRVALGGTVGDWRLLHYHTEEDTTRSQIRANPATGCTDPTFRSFDLTSKIEDGEGVQGKNGKKRCGRGEWGEKLQGPPLGVTARRRSRRRRRLGWRRQPLWDGGGGLGCGGGPSPLHAGVECAVSFASQRRINLHR
jgi:hypothetical protein